MIKTTAVTLMVAAGASITIATALLAPQVLAATGATAPKATPKPSKTTNAAPPPKSLALGQVDVTGLAPGTSSTKQLTISNPNNQDVVLRSLQTAVSGPSPAPTFGSCTSPDDFEVTVAGYNASTGVGSPVTIMKNSSISAPVTVRMHNSASRNQDACKGRSWTFTFTATATNK